MSKDKLAGQWSVSYPFIVKVRNGLRPEQVIDMPDEIRSVSLVKGERLFFWATAELAQTFIEAYGGELIAEI